MHCEVAWLYPFTRATPWRGSFKTQKRLTSFSVAPQCRGHKVARVRPALGSRYKGNPYSLHVNFPLSISLFMYLCSSFFCLCLSACLALSSPLSIHLPIFFCLCTKSFVCLFVCLLICLHIYLSIYPYIYLSKLLSILIILSTYLSISVYLSGLSISICLPIYLLLYIIIIKYLLIYSFSHSFMSFIFIFARRLCFHWRWFVCLLVGCLLVCLLAT